MSQPEQRYCETVWSFSSVLSRNLIILIVEWREKRDSGLGLKNEKKECEGIDRVCRVGKRENWRDIMKPAIRLNRPSPSQEQYKNGAAYYFHVLSHTKKRATLSVRMEVCMKTRLPTMFLVMKLFLIARSHQVSVKCKVALSKAKWGFPKQKQSVLIYWYLIKENF